MFLIVERLPLTVPAAVLLGVPAEGVSIKGTRTVSALSIAVSFLKDLISRYFRRRLNFLRNLLVLLCAPCIAKDNFLSPLLTELPRAINLSFGVVLSIGIDLGL
jgi:hypothetical protein